MRLLFFTLIATLAFLSAAHNKGLDQKYRRLQSKFSLLQSMGGANHVYNNYFGYSNYNLSYISGQKHNTQFIFNDVVEYDEVYYFSIKIHRMSPNKYIMIGVVDYNKQKLQRNSHNTNNALSYHAKAERFPQCGAEGSGYGQGDTVLVEVNRENKIIVWYVNGTKSASYTHQILGSKSRLFMPYVQMADNYDLIEVSFGKSGETSQGKESPTEL